MEQNNFNEKKNIFNGLNSIEILIRNLEKGTVDSIKKINPFMKMFFDSEMNSEIEKNAIISMTDAYYSTIVEITSGFGLSLEKAQALGSSIAHTISYTLGISKLIDKYFRGEINEDSYYSELSKRISIAALSLIKNNWDTLGNVLSGGLRGVLLFLGFDIWTVESCVTLAGNIGTLIKSRISTFFNSQKAQRFIETGLRIAGSAFKVLTQVTEKIVETGKTAVKKTKEFVKKAAEKIEVGYDKLCKSLKNGWNNIKIITRGSINSFMEWIFQ